MELKLDMNELLRMNTFAERYAGRKLLEYRVEINDGYVLTCFKSVKDEAGKTAKFGSHWKIRGNSEENEIIYGISSVNSYRLYKSNGGICIEQNDDDFIVLNGKIIKECFTKGNYTRKQLKLRFSCVKVVTDLHNVRRYMYNAYSYFYNEPVNGANSIRELMEKLQEKDIRYIVVKNINMNEMFLCVKSGALYSEDEIFGRKKTVVGIEDFTM